MSSPSLRTKLQSVYCRELQWECTALIRPFEDKWCIADMYKPGMCFCRAAPECRRREVTSVVHLARFRSWRPCPSDTGM
jgi:hypothetical protein